MQYEFDIFQFLLTGGALAPAVVFLTFALAYVYGKFGASGKVQLGLCLGTGFVLGGGLMIASNGVPADYPGWYALVIYALVMGVAEPLGYEHLKKLLGRVIQVAFERS